MKYTTVGVPNASTPPSVLRSRVWAMRAMTTNCRPVKAAADEPTMT
ncbi:MAG: hypothetical protein M3O15_01850 [Acidobacteriota bacterium]|nr:hypothetical protein [Acidobacteriota bacterium]